MISRDEAHDITLDALDESAERAANKIGLIIKEESERKNFNMLWTFNSNVDDIDRIINILMTNNFEVVEMPTSLPSIEKEYRISW